MKVKIQRIYVRVTGGLGNQIFQLLKSYKLHKETNGVIILVDRYQNDFFQSKSLSESDFRDFSLARTGFVDDETSFYCASPSALCRLIFKFRLAKIFTRDGVLRLFNNLYVDGYFIKGESFDDEVDWASSKVFEKHSISKVSGAAIHVRAGDLLRQPRNLLVTKHYYESSMEELYRRFNVNKFLVITEDIPFAKEFFSTEKSRYSFQFQSSTEIEDFLALIGSEYLITANSTFSWVAGLIGRAKHMISTEFFYKPHDKPAQLSYEQIINFEGKVMNSNPLNGQISEN